MRQRASITVLASLCLTLSANAARAQISSPCLRPLAIPDKWVENQTPPWDPTDTFDPTGPHPDVYLTGFESLTDQGLPMSLGLYNRVEPLQGRSASPVVVSEPGGGAFYEAIVTCSGYPHAIGDTFPLASGNLGGPFGAAIADLIAQDPDASWDQTANGGRGGVVNSAFAQSPRILALPVFAPDTYAAGSPTSPPTVKIVGFFVSQRTLGEVRGYLTGWSELAAAPVLVRAGEWAQLSATVTGPGSPVAGLAVEFLFEDAVVATAETDGTGTARPPTTAFQPPRRQPGHYPRAFRVRLVESKAFFVADDAFADLTVQREQPVISWAQPTDITYGTPLGPQQLNATADVPGVFSYLPGSGAVLPADSHEPRTLTVTFVPENLDLHEETTATTFLMVRPAPLLLRVNDTQKLYLDPLPDFTYSATGFVNGDGPSALGTTTFQTTAVASSQVGTHEVTFASVQGGDNYDLIIVPGVLTIVPRPTAAILVAGGPSPSIYGQPVRFTMEVSSGAGFPSGTVTLLRGDVPIATGQLVNGQATVDVSSLNAGTHPLSVWYPGAGGFAPSSSPMIAHSVGRAGTTTLLTSSVNPSRSGQAITFTATVNTVAPGAGAATGSVEFLRAGVVLATIPLANGTAQLTTSTLSVGKHAIEARYPGSTNFGPSVSAVLQQTVKGAGK
jgi:hypothetical protein